MSRPVADFNLYLVSVINHNHENNSFAEFYGLTSELLNLRFGNVLPTTDTKPPTRVLLVLLCQACRHFLGGTYRETRWKFSIVNHHPATPPHSLKERSEKQVVGFVAVRRHWHYVEGSDRVGEPVTT